MVHAHADGHFRHPVRGNLRLRARPDAGSHSHPDAGGLPGLDGDGLGRCGRRGRAGTGAGRRSGAGAAGRTPGGKQPMSGHDLPHQSFFHKYLWSTDHKMIGMQYMFTGMLMALIGGFTVYVFRMQLAYPGMSVPLFGRVSAADYNALITMHGTIMIFWVAMPVLLAGFGNFLIPLMLGCDDMVFPKVNRLSYQIFLLSAIVILSSFFVPGGPFGGAWTAYPPLSAKAAYNLTPAGATLW